MGVNEISFEGIKSDEVAKVVAQAAKFLGWDVSRDLVLKLLRSSTELDRYATLSRELVAAGSIEGALEVDEIPIFVDYIFHRAGTGDLCELLINLWEQDAAQCFCWKQDAYLHSHLVKLCGVVTTRDLNHPEVAELAIDVMDVLQRHTAGELGTQSQDPQVRELCGRSLRDGGHRARASEAGKKALCDMAQERINELSKLQEPDPHSWCQPLATLPGHPEVEAFLRGPQETFTQHSRGAELCEQLLRWEVQEWLQCQGRCWWTSEGFVLPHPQDSECVCCDEEGLHGWTEGAGAPSAL
ncbi:hypothetical protein SELMODRAFT_417760 [Selaginella moellendorffii]|uniref:Uncharacterized protein n=1 Tax=Selaginella moellendorffii TaxID=88036 RepID=D8S3J1_SELML|nr:hypothetical protein SELMODRAFT_417760 [Selaginella moellendorffii]